MASNREGEKMNEHAKAAGRPSVEAAMSFRFGNAKRPEVSAGSTFEAILRGERTATTRFATWRGSERWSRLQPGAVVRFHERQDRRGRAVDVIVVAVEEINLARMDENELERWSKLEGWTVAAGLDFARKAGGRAWQITFRDPVLCG